MDFDVNQFITKGEDGSFAVNQTAMNAAIQQHIDSQVSKGVDSYRKKQESANSQANAELVKQIDDLTLMYNKSECKAILAGDLFTERERELLLDSLVSKDLAKSQETLSALVAERKARDDAKAQKIIESLQAGQPNVNNAPAKGEQGGEKKTVTKTFQQCSQEIKDFYK